MSNSTTTVKSALHLLVAKFVDVTVYLSYSGAAAYARQRLSGMEKQKLVLDEGRHDDTDDLSSTMIHSTLSLLLHYQRLLISRFITADKSHNAADIISSSSGHTHTHTVLLLFFW